MLTSKFAEHCQSLPGDVVQIMGNDIQRQHVGLIMWYVAHAHLRQWLEVLIGDEGRRFAACQWWKEKENVDIAAFIHYCHNAQAKDGTNQARIEFFKWIDRLLAKEIGDIDFLLKLRQQLKDAPFEIAMFFFLYTYHGCESFRHAFNKDQR